MVGTGNDRYIRGTERIDITCYTGKIRYCLSTQQRTPPGPLWRLKRDLEASLVPALLEYWNQHGMISINVKADKFENFDLILT